MARAGPANSPVTSARRSTSCSSRALVPARGSASHSQASARLLIAGARLRAHRRRPPGCGPVPSGSDSPASRSGTRSSSSCQESVFSAATREPPGRGAARSMRPPSSACRPARAPSWAGSTSRRARTIRPRQRASPSSRRCASARRASLVGVMAAIDVGVARQQLGELGERAALARRGRRARRRSRRRRRSA